MESSNCSEGVWDSPLFYLVATCVRLYDQDPHSSGSQIHENVWEVEVSAYHSHWVQTETSHPPPPSNIGVVADTAYSPCGATLSHPLPSGRGQIRGQLVLPAHLSPSDGRLMLDQQTLGNNSTWQTRDTTTKTYGNSTWRASKYKISKLRQRYILKMMLDQFSPPVGVCRPDLTSASLGLAQVSQPLVTQAFASWSSFTGWGMPSNLAPTVFAPLGANFPWGVTFAFGDHGHPLVLYHVVMGFLVPPTNTVPY